MSFWRAVTDKSFPPWCGQIELKCEDPILVQQQPGFYPDRNMPRVCHVSFQLRICVRTITCLQLSVKNTVGTGSKRHKNKHSSHEFLQKSSFVVSGSLPPIIQLDSLLVSRHVIGHKGDITQCSFSVSTIKLLSPGSYNQEKLWDTSCLSATPSCAVEEKRFLFLSTSSVRETDPASKLTRTHLRMSCRHSHTAHTHSPPAPGRGWLVHGLLMQHFYRWGHFVGCRWGIQRQQDYYVGWMCTLSLSHTHNPIFWWSVSIKAERPGHAACVQLSWLWASLKSSRLNMR